MNYLQPRQRQSDGQWDFTSMNDGRVHPVGYCDKKPDPADFERLGIHVSQAELERWEKYGDKYHTDGHVTEDGAIECYRQYELDNRLRLDCKHSDEQRKCEVCGHWTDTAAMVGAYRVYELCDIHRTRDEVEKLFKGSSQIISS